MDQILLCMPTFVCYDLCIKAIQSAEAGSLKPDKYIIVDNGGSFQEYLNTLNIDKSKISVYYFNKHIGVAGSWNFFLKNFKGIKIIANDDVEFYENTIEKLVATYIQNRTSEEIIIFSPEGNGGNMFACFILNDCHIKYVGYFDENFYPAYFEDCDFAKRFYMLGKKFYYVKDCAFKHVHSATLKAFTEEQRKQHDIDFVRNREYYVKKWGGLPNNEIDNSTYGKEKK